MAVKQYYVYIMASYHGTPYTGVTKDLTRRVSEHRLQLADGFSKKYRLSKLVYFEATNDIMSAIAREKQTPQTLRPDLWGLRVTVEKLAIRVKYRPEGKSLKGRAGYFEDVAVGQGLPPLKKSIDLAHMMAYGAASWDFIRIHYDAGYAQGLGLKGPIVDGQMLGAFLCQLVQDWAGPGAYLRKLSFRNRTMCYPGDSLTCYGVVTGKHVLENEALVECDLWVENQRSDKVIQPASAVLRFPRRNP